MNDIEKALEKGAEILANFKGGADRDVHTKLEEWQACYAMLFKQLNDAAQEIRRLQKAMQPVSIEVCASAVAQAFMKMADENGLNVVNRYVVNADRLVAKAVLDAADVDWVE